MQIVVRPYLPSDYEYLITLYKQLELYGGVFDEARDAKEKLQKRMERDPDAILIAEENGTIVGTVSLIEDGRVAWLYRFCVLKNPNEKKITQSLSDKAIQILKTRGHTQVLVYSKSGDQNLDIRYKELNFNKGGDYTCFWKEI